MMRMAIFAVSLLLSIKAFSWDGQAVGRISAIDVTAANNFGFRVMMQGDPAFCSSGSTLVKWAYLNKTNDNYQLYTSALMAAMLANKQVSVHSTYINGYCEIGYVSVVN